jgi:trehalose 6-phosphate synthase/phosphatase
MGISKNMAGLEGKDKDKDGVFYNRDAGEGMGAMMVNPWDLGVSSQIPVVSFLINTTVSC